MKTVLMVAEKPSLAASLAKILSHGQSVSRKSSCRACSVHEYNGKFRGEPVHFKMTSVCGHVLSLDFLAQFNNWDKVDPSELFDAPTEKKESSSELNMERFLAQEARGVDYLVLWLDCDKEGENICFEVIDCVKRVMNGGMSSVYRAKFSAITASEIHKAMDNLGRPNENEARSVDARQELDLRIGCAFTRFQTKFFQGKYGDLDSTLISFGPCQTPTLAFCVERHDAIQTFRPESFWRLDVRVQHRDRTLSLDWERGRLFDREAVQMFAGTVQRETSAVVLSVSRKEKVKQRPLALNTVEMLRVASAGLGIGPSTTMMVAERLYTQGYISYPRTETTSYDSSFDLKAAVRPLASVWGMRDAVRELLASGGGSARGGHDVGDHPPITPLRAATEAELGGDAWRLYQYIVAHFLASLSPDCRYASTTMELRIGHERFSMTGKKLIKPGFTALLPSMAIRDDETVPDLASGAELAVQGVRVADGQTSAPDYLTESELISLMEEHGIGTDASIPVHINNICQRNYVTVSAAGRRLTPTTLGVVLVHGYQKIDRSLVQAGMRSSVERQLNLIAAGKADFDAVLQHTLATFRAKFDYFVAQVAAMDQLFEVSFSPLAESGRPLSRCGRCNRYMKYISARPQRLYCPHCDETYALPANGAIKLNKEIKCPLDNFELVLWSAGGRGKTFSLCPYCYSHPPFAGMKKGSPCTQCFHPTCAQSLTKLAVASCDECEDGTLVIDPNSGPSWKMFCNAHACTVLLHLCQGAFSVAVRDAPCATCDAMILVVEFHKDRSPLDSGETKLVACMFCDPLLSSLVRWETAVAKHPMHRRGRGGGKKGRGGHRRRGTKPKDKMAQLEAYFV